MIPLLASFLLCVTAVAMYAIRVRHESGASDARPATDVGVPRAVLGVVLQGFALRVLLGAILLRYGWASVLAPDAGFYADVGDLIARLWVAAGHIDINNLMREGQTRFVLVNAMAAYWFGDGHPVMLLLTSAAGAWTSLVAWRIARHLGGPFAARQVLYLAAFFPSQVLWSSLDLRDPFLVLAVAGSAWAMIQLKEQWSVSAALRVVAWCMLIAVFRDYILVVVGGAAVIAFVGGTGRRFFRDVLIAATILGAVGLITVKMGFGYEHITNLSLDRAYRVRMGFSWTAGSAYLQDVNTGTVTGALSILPIGALYFLFGPLPWLARGVLQMLTVPEMLFWYWLVPKCWFGARECFRRNGRATWVLLSFIGVLVAAYALVSGNVGTAYRHRAQVLPLLLIFAGIGWTAQAERRRAARFAWRSPLRIGAGRRQPIAAPGMSPGGEPA